MTNQEFKKELDLLLKPLGFMKKGNKWTLETEELEKVIELQKSNFSNSYYINFGFNFKDLDYDKVTMHIFNRLGSQAIKKSALMAETLDLESSLNRTERINLLKKFVSKLLLPEIDGIKNKADLVNELKVRKNLNDVPLKVKNHLDLINE